MARLTKKAKERKRETKKKKKSNREQLMAAIPGVKYSGSGTDPAVNALLKILKEKGAGSLDSSGFGSHYNWKGKKI